LFVLSDGFRDGLEHGDEHFSVCTPSIWLGWLAFNHHWQARVFHFLPGSAAFFAEHIVNIATTPTPCV
jgi:hypothetical protein